MGSHVHAHEGIEPRRAVAERHRRSVPESILVIGQVVNSHLEFLSQRAGAIPILVHIKHNFSKRLSVVEGGVRSIYLLHCVVVTRKLKWSIRAVGGTI